VNLLEIQIKIDKMKFQKNIMKTKLEGKRLGKSFLVPDVRKREVLIS